MFCSQFTYSSLSSASGKSGTDTLELTARLVFYPLRSQTSSGGGRMERFSLGATVGGERTSTVVIMGEESSMFRREEDEMQL